MSQASLQVQFLVLGGTIGGLASAISLRRAGHDVTLLEFEDEHAYSSGFNGCTIPPNMSKLLLRWGLEDQLNEAAALSRTVFFTHYEKGEVIGKHTWQEELFKDAGGSLLCIHFDDVRKMLYLKAMSEGANIVKCERISAINLDDDERPSVELSCGQTFEADVIIGASQFEQISRKEVIGKHVSDVRLGMLAYSITITQDSMATDPELSILFEQTTASRAWLGPSRGALGFATGTRPEYTLVLFLPESEADDPLARTVLKDKVLSIMGDCEPRLRKLVELSSSESISCVPLAIPPEIETWVHSSDRLVLLGDGAHPSPRCSMNEVSIAVCDAACLGELFRHLHSMDQIPRFLEAFENLRRGHVKQMLEADLGTYSIIMMPPGEEHEQRDNALRKKLKAGINALAGDEDDDVAGVWERDKAVFAYDAEDHAADWWNDWGLLQERAQNRVHLIRNSIPLFETQQIVVQSIDVN